jgi:hypothetical protein
MGKMSERALQAEDSRKAKAAAKADFAAPSPAQTEPLVPEREITEVLIAVTIRSGKVGTVLARDGLIVEASEVVKKMKGWDGQMFRDYCREQGMEWEVVSRTTAKMRG